jgi:hypothetical protein
MPNNPEEEPHGATHHYGSDQSSESILQSAPTHQHSSFPRRPHGDADFRPAPCGRSGARAAVPSQSSPTAHQQQPNFVCPRQHFRCLPLPRLALAAQLTSHFHTTNAHDEIAAPNGMAVAASITSPLSSTLSANPTAARSHARAPPRSLPLHGHRVRAPRLGTVATW